MVIFYFRFDRRHVAFGRLKEGMEVLNAIEGCGSIDGTPRFEVRITDCGVLVDNELVEEEDHH